MSQTEERFIWAAELINVQSFDYILEIGCGAGLLINIIASKLTEGHLIGVDKSESMLKKAGRRNASFLANGRLALVDKDFLEFSTPDVLVDKVVAFNVNIFWKSPEPALKIVKRVLKPDGELYIFYQLPSGDGKQLMESIMKNLVAHDFKIQNTEVKKLKPAPAFCIIAKL